VLKNGFAFQVALAHDAQEIAVLNAFALQLAK
jgi:hypothetical protein